jgi:heme oxygenase (biliverdin-IX-beta and delta-forming)
VSAVASLRAATAADHEQVDRLFSSLDFAVAADYRRFLLAQAAAFLPVERALDEAGAASLLPDWTERRRGSLLIADLEELDASPPEPLACPALDSAGIWGALYVIEGSRLGGALLKRGLPPAAPRRFLAAPQNKGSWRNLLRLIDQHLIEPQDIETGSAAARMVFSLFERAGRLHLEKNEA